MPVYRVGKFPFGNKLVVVVGIGCVDLHLELQDIAGGLGAGIVVVEPAYVEAVEIEGMGIFFAAGSYKRNNGEEQEEEVFHDVFKFGSNVGRREGTTQEEGRGLKGI